jgi:hypothetical protein
VFVNIDGTEKVPLLVTAKSKQPCFRNSKLLPCTYHHNTTAWMTHEIFHEFLVSLDRRMVSKKQDNTLFVDHSPAHPKDVQNLNVQVEFFPANRTSVLQPMDQGIISVLKQKFYRSFLLKLLQTLNSTKDSYKMFLLDALPMLAVAWNPVAKCFMQAEFLTNADPVEKDEDGDDRVSCDEWSNLQEKLNIVHF